MTRPKALVSWSSGKDSAYALWEARQRGELDIVGILTTVTATYERVSMHGVRETLLDRQAAELGLPCWKVRIPAPCPNELYEAEMARVLVALRADGISEFVFGDLFLEDIRAYREAKLAAVGMRAVFPLWGRDTRTLARDMLASGLGAVTTCIDPKKLPASFAGRDFDERFLAQLPSDVDPCGENGEFHTFVRASPLFAHPIGVRVGPVVERDGFVFADLQ